jgi:excisionase family DNA binding protein
METKKHNLLTVKEGAEFLHLQESTIRAWLLQKKLPHVKLGGRVFLRREDLGALLSASFVPAVSPGPHLRRTAVRRKRCAGYDDTA